MKSTSLALRVTIGAAVVTIAAIGAVAVATDANAASTAPNSTAKPITTTSVSPAAVMKSS